MGRRGDFSALSGTSFLSLQTSWRIWRRGRDLHEYYRPLRKRLVELRNHGQPERYVHTRIGINGRMDSFQAVALLAKLETSMKKEI